jgi:uncharacterized membrane protein YfcA
MDLTLTIAGSITGILIGLTGVGGGAIMTPLLVLLGVPPLSAIGTDLWFAAITKLTSASFSHRSGLVDWSVVRRLWMGSLPASFGILVWIIINPIGDTYVPFLKTAIALMVLIAAVGLIFQSSLHSLGRKLRTTKGDRFKALQNPLTVLSGVILGVFVTFTSVGAGALGVVVLAYLYPLRLVPARLVATDIAHAIPLAVFAGLGHLYLGNVQINLLANLLLGSIPSVIIGSKLSTRMPQKALRWLLAMTLFLVSASLGLSNL